MSSIVLLIPLLAAVIVALLVSNTAARSEQQQHTQQEQQDRQLLLNRWRSALDQLEPRLEQPFPKRGLPDLVWLPQQHHQLLHQTQAATQPMPLGTIKRQLIEPLSNDDDYHQGNYQHGEVMPLSAPYADDCANAVPGMLSSCSPDYYKRSSLNEGGADVAGVEDSDSASDNTIDVDQMDDEMFRTALLKRIPSANKRAQDQSNCHCQSMHATTKELLWEPIDMGAGFYPRHAMSKVCNLNGCRKFGHKCHISKYRVNAIKRSMPDMIESYNSSMVNIDCHCMLA